MRAVLGALLCTVALVGCSGGGQPTAVATPTGAASFDPNAAFEALPDCPPLPSPAAFEKPEGLHLPDEAVITSSRNNGPLTQVQGFVGLTPIQVRLYYEERKDLKVLHLEDEGFESEILVSDGENRLFVKAQASCSRGSNMVAVLAPEDEAGAVPVPAGSPTPPAGG